MKILVLNGSPKGEKSDTMHITRAFLDGMNEVSKNDIKIIEVISKHIEYCRGDLGCMRNGGKCVHDDDMAGILEEILESDLLLFSFPLYGFGVPAPLKALLDRTLPLGSIAMQKVGDRYEHVSQADYSHLRYFVISGCGFPNAKHNFEAMTLQFRLRFSDGVGILTVPESPMFSVPEAQSVTKPYLALVRQAGREYAADGRISDALAEKLAVPMIPDEVYASIVNSGVRPQGE